MQDVDIGGAFDNVEDAECAVAGAVSDLPHALADAGHGLPVARIRALLHKSQIRTGFHAGTCRKAAQVVQRCADRSEEHTSELQSLMRISYAVFCLKKKINHKNNKI